MKARKPRDLMHTLEQKGFQKEPSNKKTHHVFFYYMHNNKKTPIHTYFSHGKGSKDYGASLMSKIKKQLKFSDSGDCEAFFDCHFTKEHYSEMLNKSGLVTG